MQSSLMGCNGVHLRLMVEIRKFRHQCRESDRCGSRAGVMPRRSLGRADCSCVQGFLDRARSFEAAGSFDGVSQFDGFSLFYGLSCLMDSFAQTWS